MATVSVRWRDGPSSSTPIDSMQGQRRRGRMLAERHDAEALRQLAPDCRQWSGSLVGRQAEGRRGARAGRLVLATGRWRSATAALGFQVCRPASSRIPEVVHRLQAQAQAGLQPVHLSRSLCVINRVAPTMAVPPAGLMYLVRLMHLASWMEATPRRLLGGAERLVCGRAGSGEARYRFTSMGTLLNGRRSGASFGACAG